jgi:hypothetical protein
MEAPPLYLITALARSGALDQAWALFEAGGYSASVSDSSALAVKGRLLKDRGLRAAGGERRAFFVESAKAYAAADALSPQPYLLINVATLAFLSGDQERGSDLARATLERLDAPAHVSETPYWLAATRAEALLLCDDQEGASRALATAIRHNPDGWKDHASTLRQLRLILSEDGRKADWLDAFSPPASLHFVGHLGVGETDALILRAKVDALLEQERIGFGYGALAAGADIIIAEALLARGATLNVVLPVSLDTYLAQSVDRIGDTWRARFVACVEAAASLTEVTSLNGEFEPLSIALAGDYSMGAAVLNARTLESRACQIIVADEGVGPFGTGLYSARDAQRWQARGHLQHVIQCPRTQVIAASGLVAPEQPVPSRRLAALLHAVLYGVESLTDAQWPLLEDCVFQPLRDVLTTLLAQPFQSRNWGTERALAFDDVTEAHAAARALLACFSDIDLVKVGLPSTLTLTLGGHYDIIHWNGRPDSDVYGPSVMYAGTIAAMAPKGSFCVSESFANALAFQTDETVTAEYVGDLETGRPCRLFAIKG